MTNLHVAGYLTKEIRSIGERHIEKYMRKMEESETSVNAMVNFGGSMIVGNPA